MKSNEGEGTEEGVSGKKARKGHAQRRMLKRAKTANINRFVGDGLCGSGGY